jgi:RNA polymerase sigma-70 factor, ECF subfamily
MTDLEADFERHRAGLRAHCYRMLGSFEDAEDLVQETFLRAWRGRASFGAEGRFAVRAWLYRIATNACLDVLRSRPPRVLMTDVPAADPSAELPPPADLPWLQPYPDALLAPSAEEAVMARETIELAFIAAIQHLPPRQRAVLLLRDVLGWRASDVAGMLEVSVAAANSLLQRARETLRERLGERTRWAPASPPTDEERELLRRYVDAHERPDPDALAALLLEDARLVMPPIPTWFDGRDAIVTASAQGFEPAFGRLRAVVTRFNHRPATAWYLQRPGEPDHRPLAMDVLRLDGGAIAEITSFVYPELFGRYGLPMSLPADPV